VAGGALLAGLDRMLTLAAQIQTDAFEERKHQGNLDFAAKRLDSGYYVRSVEVTEI